MRIRWTPAAADDLEAIADYLTKHFPSFTQTTIREIYETILCAPYPSVAALGVKMERGSLSLHVFPISSSIGSRQTLLRSCTSTMAHRIGPELFGF